MANYPAVSVIIPMFNAERFIAECLESLLVQTFQDFEVVVVNDCSTDKSCAVVENYLHKFNGRLTLSRMEKNSGSGAAPRNKGMNLSRGEFVFFMDADDLITPTALKEMYSLAENYNVDVVYCEKYYRASADLSEIYIFSEQKGRLVNEPTFETEDLAERINEIIAGKFHGVPWSKFVRRDFLIEHEIFFPHVKISEDELWTYGLLFCAKKFLRVPNVIYVFRQTENSISRIERTPSQTINFWINPLIKGLKTLDNLMNKTDFFKQNPQYRCALLENFVHTRLSCLFEASRKTKMPAIYGAIKEEFGEIFGEHDVLLSILLADLIEQQKIFMRLQERITELEKTK
mgnify:CR=1 FL=1